MSEGLQFYRCILCGKVINIWDIKSEHGCPRCKNNRIRPTELGPWEKIIQICKHPKIWTWGDVSL